VSISWEEHFPRSKSKHCACKKTVLHDVGLFEAGVPDELWRADTIVPENNKQHFETLKSYAAQMGTVVREEGLSLLLHGENGTGKTTCATIAIIAALRAGMSAALVTWADAIRSLVQDAYNAKHQHALEARLLRDLLVIDELGKETVPSSREGLSSSRLDALMRERKARKFPTILVTNLSLADFTRIYGRSVASQLATPYRVLSFVPGDYRPRRPDAWAKLGK
jgi:DNA replication protein DnaC